MNGFLSLGLVRNWLLCTDYVCDACCSHCEVSSVHLTSKYSDVVRFLSQRFRYPQKCLERRRRCAKWQNFIKLITWEILWEKCIVIQVFHIVCKSRQALHLWAINENTEYAISISLVAAQSESLAEQALHGDPRTSPTSAQSWTTILFSMCILVWAAMSPLVQAWVGHLLLACYAPVWHLAALW